LSHAGARRRGEYVQGLAFFSKLQNAEVYCFCFEKAKRFAFVFLRVNE